MILGSNHSGFVFSLPNDFISKEFNESYMKILDKNHIGFPDVLSFINSTIKSITIPGFAQTTGTQYGKYGKEIQRKNAQYLSDLTTSREINVTFKSINNDLNYMFMIDLFLKHYVTTYNEQYIKNFQLFMVDEHRDLIFTINFFQLVYLSISDNIFDYSQQKISGKEFTATFSFNWMGIEYCLDDKKIMDSSLVPIIVQLKK